VKSTGFYIFLGPHAAEEGGLTAQVMAVRVERKLIFHRT
jgi:hypothetical protein